LGVVGEGVSAWTGVKMSWKNTNVGGWALCR
jgi:hypothetical protein